MALDQECRKQDSMGCLTDRKASSAVPLQTKIPAGCDATKENGKRGDRASPIIDFCEAM